MLNFGLFDSSPPPPVFALLLPFRSLSLSQLFSLLETRRGSVARRPLSFLSSRLFGANPLCLYSLSLLRVGKLGRALQAPFLYR